jgi:NOL1/NOP2/sun family putative RNA methylase
VTLKADLPEAFVKKTKVFDRDQSPFIDVYHQLSFHGFRLNPSKPVPSIFLKHYKKIPWCKNGYYIDQEKLGNHPYHHAGAFYIQEPSAMAVVEMMDIQPNDVVLDLCAAPGGKSTQIASYLSSQGLLIANEIDQVRSQILLSNLERMGITNAVVTNQDPKVLIPTLKTMFDRILVDAPCSGEGLFRKEPQSRNQWSEALVTSCALRQKDILHTAALKLKPGGTLVYSTCTFSSEENEEVITHFLNSHPDFYLYKHPLFSFFNEKVTGGIGVKILPNEVDGEGHYVAVLKKVGTLEFKDFKQWTGNTKSAIFNQFILDNLKDFKASFTFQHKDYFYLLPKMEEHRHLHIVRAGLMLGSFKDIRFVPSHHLSHALKDTQAQRTLDLTLEDSRVNQYLKGEELVVENQEEGWNLVTVDHLPLGWGKVSKGKLKNHYPKGLRLL